VKTRDNTNIHSIDIAGTYESSVRNREDEYEVVYQVTYTTYYNSDSRAARVQTFRYTKATIKLDKTTGKYLIVDLGGADHFEKIYDSE